MVFPRTTSTTIYGTYDFWQRILKHNGLPKNNKHNEQFH